MRKWNVIVMALAIVLIALPAFAEGESKEDKKEAEAAERRAEIDKVAGETLDTLFEKAEKSKALYDEAYGWAVFDNLKIAFILSGGGGSGVAVDKGSEARSYMKMGTGGIGIGIGGQKYQVVFLFQDKETFTNFVEKGWKAESGARAAGGTAGTGVATAFDNGMAVYQFNEAGLMASADITGTKFWLDKKLNK